MQCRLHEGKSKWTEVENLSDFSATSHGHTLSLQCLRLGVGTDRRKYNLGAYSKMATKYDLIFSGVGPPIDMYMHS